MPMVKQKPHANKPEATSSSSRWLGGVDDDEDEDEAVEFISQSLYKMRMRFKYILKPTGRFFTTRVYNFQALSRLLLGASIRAIA